MLGLFFRCVVTRNASNEEPTCNLGNLATSAVPQKLHACNTHALQAQWQCSCWCSCEGAASRTVGAWCALQGRAAMPLHLSDSEQFGCRAGASARRRSRSAWPRSAARRWARPWATRSAWRPSALPPRACCSGAGVRVVPKGTRAIAPYCTCSCSCSARQLWCVECFA